MKGKRDNSMGWMYLLIASVFEILFALMIRSADGFTRLWPTLGIMVTGTFGAFFLSLAMRTLPMGTTYAVWTGIGVAGTTVIGIGFLHEPLNVWRIVCIGLILTGIVGLRLVASSGQ
jgi:quaternary ammonium compound-resistance protein SugE